MGGGEGGNEARTPTRSCMLDMIGQARMLLKIMLTLLRTSCLWQMELDRQQCDIIKDQELMWGGGDVGRGVVVVVDRVPTFTCSFCV